MEPTIPPVLQVVPVLVLVAVSTAIVKLSAAVSRFRLSWLHSFLFAVILGAALIAGRALFALTQVSIPLAAGTIVSLCVNLVLGGWFLRHRATRRSDGQPAGVTGGMRISSVMVLLCGGITLVFLGILGQVTQLHR